MKKNSDLLIIIPAYNEESNIVDVVNNLVHNYNRYDYIIVNDGSSDNTLALCRQHNFNVIDLPINLGLSGAVQTGMLYAYRYNYDYALQLDGDGQHNPFYIAKMLEVMKEEDAAIVIGSRFINKKRPLSARMAGNFLLELSIRITTGTKISDPTSGMRLYNKKMINYFANQINYDPEPDTIAFLLNKGEKITEIQVDMLERQSGTSYLTFFRSIKYMSRVFCSIWFLQWARTYKKE